MNTIQHNIALGTVSDITKINPTIHTKNKTIQPHFGM